MNGRIRVERYGRRNWAVYELGELVCVTLYKCGAESVRDRLSRPHHRRKPTKSDEQQMRFAMEDSK